MSRAGGEKALFAAERDLHRNAAELAGQEGRHRFFQYVLFIAKTTADIGLNNPHAGPRNAERLTDDPAHDVGIWVLVTMEMRESSSIRANEVTVSIWQCWMTGV